MHSNPRNANGNLRRKYRRRYKAMQAPCALCGGRLGAIHYDEPSTAEYPLSFVIDEKIPVSKFWLGGYESPRQCAEDFSNTQPAHYICNQMKGNKTNFSLQATTKKKKRKIELDGNW